MARVSVIVAAYNAGKYINKCLSSLERQTLKDIEIICVDDASTDNTASILDEYARRDSRFRILRMPENSGPVKARNKALKSCSSEIVAYLDADDWYADNTLELLCNTFDKYPDAGCVLFDCIMVYEDGSQKPYEGKKFTRMSGQEAFRDSFDWTIHGVCAARAWLYERQPVDDTCSCYSDDNTTRIHYYMSREVVQSDAPYFYLQHSESLTHKPSVTRMQYLLASDILGRQLREMGCQRDVLSLHETQRWKIIVDGYYFYFTYRKLLTDDEKRYCLDVIQRTWRTSDFSLVDPKIRRKFGYNPLRFSWTLFRLEEEIYFRLRRILGRG